MALRRHAQAIDRAGRSARGRGVEARWPLAASAKTNLPIGALASRQALRRQGGLLPGTLRALWHDKAPGLMGPQLGVEPAAIKQVRMGALIDNSPAIHHHKPVHELQRLFGDAGDVADPRGSLRLWLCQPLYSLADRRITLCELNDDAVDCRILDNLNERRRNVVARDLTIGNCQTRSHHAGARVA